MKVGGRKTLKPATNTHQAHGEQRGTKEMSRMHPCTERVLENPFAFPLLASYLRKHTSTSGEVLIWK